MRIAINCRSILLANRTGIGRYTYNLLEHLGRIDHENSYLLYAHKGLFDRKRRFPAFAYPNFKNAWDFLKLGPQRFLKKADIYHVPSPQVLEPIPGVKLVVTIHDLIYKTHPKGHTQATIDATANQMDSIVQHADHIICISESTRSDLHKFFNLPSEKTSVVYNGVAHHVFYPLKDNERISAVDFLKKMNIDRPYILFVGTIEPRKNLQALIKAFAELKKSNFDGLLVVAGMKGWMIDQIMPLIEGHGLKDRIVFCGFVSDDQLRILYGMAEVFAFPSLYEGFGFPILEAFCCGTPVVTSNTSSCGEVAGDAALTVNPNDVKGLAAALMRVLNNKDFGTELKTKGLARAREFSFQETAKKTLGIYQKVMS